MMEMSGMLMPAGSLETRVLVACHSLQEESQNKNHSHGCPLKCVLWSVMVTKVDLLGCCVQFLVLYFEMHFKSGGDYGKGPRARALDSGSKSKPKTLTGSFLGRKNLYIKGKKVSPAFFMRGHSIKGKSSSAGNGKSSAAVPPIHSIISIWNRRRSLLQTFYASSGLCTRSLQSANTTTMIDECIFPSAAKKCYRKTIFETTTVCWWPPSFQFQGKRCYDKIALRRQYLWTYEGGYLNQYRYEQYSGLNITTMA